MKTNVLACMTARGAAILLATTTTLMAAPTLWAKPAATPAAPAVDRIAQEATQATAAEQAALLADGRITSEALVRAYLARIAAIDDSGPQINAVIALFPDAIAQARTLDEERRYGFVRGPLHGIPVLIKDNIEVAGPVPTTAGSAALADNITNRDAPLVARLREGGMIILGKTNLSEWANIRSGKSTSGWSTLGGLTKNPYRLAYNSCGSSSGSGAAMAARLASVAVGTETDGSIVCPSGTNGIVGFKPTVGLVSRRFIVPISRSQDTAGPMTRSVRDAALMLDMMAGSDPHDPATEEADLRRENYGAALERASLAGKRIGVVRLPDTNAALFDQALARLRAQGAELVEVDISALPIGAISESEFATLLIELKADMAAYLQGLPAESTVKHRTLEDLVAFNAANAGTALKYFGQETFEAALKQPDISSAAYSISRSTSQRMAGPEGIDMLLDRYDVDVLVAQTNGPAWRSTLGKGDRFSGPSASTLPAVAGYPHLTVPAGLIDGLPIGISFIGPKWSDADVLATGYLFEKSGRELPPPAYVAEASSKKKRRGGRGQPARATIRRGD